MTMPDSLIDKTIEEASHGSVKMTTRGRAVSIRFGLPPGRVLRNYDDGKDTWLCVRKIYRDGGYRWYATGLTRDWKNHNGRIVSGRQCSRFKSRQRLEGAIRSISRGSGGAYVEVLPWNEAEEFSEPKPLSEVEHLLGA